jgi:hypothetical protein
MPQGQVEGEDQVTTMRTVEFELVIVSAHALGPRYDI